MSLNYCVNVKTRNRENEVFCHEEYDSGFYRLNEQGKTTKQTRRQPKRNGLESNSREEDESLVMVFETLDEGNREEEWK